MKIISPISLDLGAKYTGVHHLHFEERKDPASGNVEGHVIVIGNDITWSQVNRRQKRHQSYRNYPRRQMAKRLLRVILREAYGIDPFQWKNKKDTEFLYGLFNRRGFNRLEDEEASFTPEEWLKPVFAKAIPELDRYDSFEHWWVSITTDESTDYKDLLHQLGKKQDFLNELDESVKEDKEAIKVAFDSLRSFLNNAAQKDQEGHLHRKQYFRNIRADIEKEVDGRLCELFTALTKQSVTPAQFANLIGHISNLQLRTLRQYFNNKSFQRQDRWLPKWFTKQFWRSIERWHCKNNPDAKTNKQKLLSCKGSTDILSLLLNLNPDLTIPPYEDQNNRRPPKDKSLFLNTQKLDKHYPGWRVISQAFGIHFFRELGVKHAQVVVDCDQAPAPPENRSKTKNPRPRLDKDAIILQRILDRSLGLDPFKIRHLARKHSLSQKLTTAKEAFHRQIGKQHYEPLIKLAKAYYDEIDLAKNGLWSEEYSELLFCLNRTPPQKNKVLAQLVGNLMGADLGADCFQKITELKKQWSDKAIGPGKQSLQGFCDACAKLQKDHGNALKYKLQEALSLERQIKKNQSSAKLSADHKKLIKMQGQVSGFAEEICKLLGVTQKAAKERLANIFQLAQLFNLIDRDPKGFSKLSRPAIEENHWRSLMQTSDDGLMVANASLLAADSIRPFDGLLNRLLERQADRIARQKMNQIEHTGPIAEHLHIPILLEENRFRFTEDLQAIKQNKKKEKQATKGLAEEQAAFQEKDQRIRNASNGLCPYTGSTLDNRGEYDHIIPRSRTVDRFGAVYNSEANLIYCTREGNRKKADQLYTLGNLNKKYLKKIFKTSDATAIEKIIRQHIEPIIKQGELISFHTLKPDIQASIRHALFVGDLRDDVLNLLSGHTKARVNGTQAWLAKLIIKKLRHQLKVKIEPGKLTFTIVKMPTESVSRMRQFLGYHQPELAKINPQPVASHAIDAAMVAGSLISDSRLAKKMGVIPPQEKSHFDWLTSLLPQQITIDYQRTQPLYRKDNPQSSPLFKAGMYGERFLPLLVGKEDVRIGFNPGNSTKVKKGAGVLFQLLQPFLQRSKSDVELPASLSALQGALEESKYQVLYVNKPHAMIHLHQFDQDDTHEQQCHALLLLYYQVKKQDIKKRLCGQGKNKDEDKKTFKKREDILKNSDFAISVKKEKDSPLADSIVIENKAITLPCKQAWERLLEKPALNSKLGKKETVTDVFWQEISNPELSSKYTDDRQHRKVRKVYSLPVKATGGNYRVRRYTPEGNMIWQALSTGDFKGAGFDTSAGKINNKKVVELPLFSKSPNLAPIKRDVIRNPHSWVSLDEWRSLPLDIHIQELGVIRLELCPGSIGRCKVRLAIQTDILFAALNQHPDSHYSSIYQLPPEITDVNLLDADIFNHYLIPRPRTEAGKLKEKPKIMSISTDNVVLEYGAGNGMNPTIKKAYDQGRPVCT